MLGCLFKTAKNKTGSDLTQVKPIEWVSSLNLPVFFMVGKEDNLAKPYRVKELFDKYGGEDKQFYLIEGTHQSVRDQTVIKKAVAFALRTFTMDALKTEKLRNLSIHNQESLGTKGSRFGKSSVEYHSLLESDPTLLIPGQTKVSLESQDIRDMKTLIHEEEALSVRHLTKNEPFPKEHEPMEVRENNTSTIDKLVKAPPGPRMPQERRIGPAFLPDLENSPLNSQYK